MPHQGARGERATLTLLRVRVLLTRAGLDARIAAADVARAPALELRAAQLARIATRRPIARGLRNAVVVAREELHRWM